MSSHTKLFKSLIDNRSVPEEGLNEVTIKYILNQISLMDSNNGLSHIGIGEREGRILSSIVKDRHFNLVHGIGRSGHILDLQPKAVGSSFLYKLTNALLLNFLKSVTGISFIKEVTVFPVATGMALQLTYLTLKQRNSLGKYVIFSRIDQKTCLKSIISSGLVPIIVDVKAINEELDQLDTDIDKINQIIERGEYENEYYDHSKDDKDKKDRRITFSIKEILCISSVTSCFAPRSIDNIIELSKISKKHSIPHVINSAYGIFCGKITEELIRSNTEGRVDVIISSTDKNFLTPVGGSFIYSSNKEIINEIGENYPGRASISPILDLFITLLETGKSKYKYLMKERLDLFNTLYKDLSVLVKNSLNEKMFLIKRNKISMAMSLSSTTTELKIKDYSQLTFLGGIFFNRQVSGVKVVVPSAQRNVNGMWFYNYSSHSTKHKEGNLPCLVFAVSIGMSKFEVESFKSKIIECVLEFKRMYMTKNKVNKELFSGKEEGDTKDYKENQLEDDN